MNKDQFLGRWREFKGKIKEKWGKLTDDDIAQINGKWDQLSGRLQRKYGWSREQAEREMNAWCSSCEQRGTHRDVNEYDVEESDESESLPNRYEANRDKSTQTDRNQANRDKSIQTDRNQANRDRTNQSDRNQQNRNRANPENRSESSRDRSNQEDWRQRTENEKRFPRKDEKKRKAS